VTNATITSGNFVVVREAVVETALLALIVALPSSANGPPPPLSDVNSAVSEIAPLAVTTAGSLAPVYEPVPEPDHPEKL
jgi:hypothetical protein